MNIRDIVVILSDLFLDTMNPILLTLFGASFTIFIAIIFKFIWKSNSEKIFEKNEKRLYELLFTDIPRVFIILQNTFKILKDANFQINKFFMEPCSDDTYDALKHLHDNLDLIDNYFPSFHDVSRYIPISDYLLIKKYLNSSRIFQIPNKKSSDLKNVIIFEYDVFISNAFYAKKLIKQFADYLPRDFVLGWEKILNDEEIHKRKDPTKIDPIWENRLDYDLLHK